jgi:ADP-dependent NAD(P)H-hydrate dehydratase / NAD(P)H-hydrate epimerase
VHELLTTSEMARADAAAIASGTPGAQLMEQAGRAVADVVARLFRGASRIVVLCGPGNNGGDGFVAARVLHARGYRVELALLGSRAALKGDAAGAAAAWRGAVLPLADAPVEEADGIIDALFGAGLARDLDGDAAAVVARVNASGKPVVAVDVPSGVDGNGGEVRGIAVRAQETVTFFRLKPGHLLYPGRGLCGRVRLADIGIPESVLDEIRPAAFRNDPALFEAMVRAPDAEGHKYGRGHALVVSGPIDGTGAARLSARAALRIGAGLVTVASPGSALAVNAAALTAVMVRRSDGAEGLSGLLADTRRNAVVLGPAVGVGEQTRALVAAALASPAHAVLDADALASFANDSGGLASLVARRPGADRQGIVLTPHEGEFRKLFSDVQGLLDERSKLERARRAAGASGAVVVLKGPDTVIAAPDGRAAINANATPFLATAGSGDVLSGFVGGLLAQSVPAFEAACAAVWFHGAAGSALGPGLIAEDLPEALPKVLRDYFER